MQNNLGVSSKDKIYKRLCSLWNTVFKEDQTCVISYQDMLLQSIGFILYTTALGRKSKISIYEKLHQAKYFTYIISFIITVLEMKTQALRRVKKLSQKGKVKGIYFKNCFNMFLECLLCVSHCAKAHCGHLWTGCISSLLSGNIHSSNL